MSDDRVLFSSLRSSVTGDDLGAVERVLNSGQLILGDEVRKFETDWAACCGVPHAVGVGNGLDAIEIGLRAADIGPGDEVITTSMTAVASVLGIIRAGATPVLADVNSDTALLDLASVERCITSATRAVLLVHLYGQMRDMHLWVEFCANNDIELIEDCAQSHLAAYEGKSGGSWGMFGAYSFYPTKNLGSAGDAGALVTQVENLARVAQSLRNYGQENRYEHSHIGLNSRLDELQAAVLSSRLPKLAQWNARRREIALNYRDHINNPVVSLLSAPIAPENHVHHLFVVLTDYRRELQAHLTDCGVETLIHYPIPVHRQPSLTHLARDLAGLSKTELHADRCLSLPCSPHLTDDELMRVIDAVNAFSPS